VWANYETKFRLVIGHLFAHQYEVFFTWLNVQLWVWFRFAQTDRDAA
jgi:hypothetical protein